MSRFRAQVSAAEIAPLGKSTVQVRLSVRNLSDRPWPARGPVRLAYQVLDSSAESLLLESERTSFTHDVPPGGEAEANLTIELPARALPNRGTYRVIVSPVEDPVAWFYQRGSECLELDVEVDGGNVRATQRRVTAGARRWQSWHRQARKLVTLPFSAIARNRALILAMVRRDIHGRYRGSVAGLFWTVIHPVLLMLTYFFVFAVVLKVRFGPEPDEAGSMNFLLYFIAGMLPWLAFSEALSRAPAVLLEHRTLVTRVLFPVEILPVNITVGGLVSQFFLTIVFMSSLLWLKGGIPIAALWLPVVFVPQVLLTIGLCWFLAALGVFLRDTGQVMAFLLTLWFFATPICYPEAALPAQARGFFEANPLYVLVRAYRAIFLERSAPDWAALGILWAAAAATFVLGYAWFHKSRKSFADVL